MLEEFNEEKLTELLKAKNWGVQLVVISACHSNDLGRILHEAGIPVVVSINTQSKVLEKAAYTFNKMFLEQLVAGKSPKEAFDVGLANVRSSEESNNKILCSNHDHSDDCLWFQYKEKFGRQEAENLLKWDCKCFKSKGLGPIEHNYDCAQYRNYFNKLVNLNKEANEVIVDNKIDDPRFLKRPFLSYEKDKKTIWCCCQRITPHNESQKFLINGNMQALNTPIF